MLDLWRKAGRHRGTVAAGVALAAALLILTAQTLPGGLPSPGPAAAQQTTSLGIDANPSGNEATSLGPTDTCRATSSGQTFDMDLIVRDVDQLLAWEIYIDFDDRRLEVVDRNVDLFQGANAGSNVFDVSDRLPDTESPYRAAAADTSDPPTPDSGSGVMARLTFKAKASGVAAIAVSSLDINDDGAPDFGAFLRNANGGIIGNEDDDVWFDGPTQGAEVAIDRPCAGVAVPPDNSDSSLSMNMAAWIAAGAVATALVAIAGVALFQLRRRRLKAGDLR